MCPPSRHTTALGTSEEVASLPVPLRFQAVNERSVRGHAEGVPKAFDAARVPEEELLYCEILLEFQTAVFYMNICSNVMSCCDQS